MTVHGCGAASIQGDVRFADVLQKMGATVKWSEDSITVSRDLNRRLQGVDVDCGDIPDAAMTLAVTLNIRCWTTRLHCNTDSFYQTPTRTTSTITGSRAIC